MEDAILEVSILFNNGTEKVIHCTETEYNKLMTEGRFTSSMISAYGYFDCYIKWDDVSFISITDVIQGDDYGQDEATTAA